jgi:signal transduction histidine kinase
MLQILINHIDSFSRDELKQFAISSDHTVRNLRNLLDNLLEWSRTQRSTIHYEPEAVSLDKMVTDIYSLLEVTAINKKIAVYADIPYELMVFADRNMLHFVMRNLIDNAIKFTGEGGKVWVKATCGNDRAEISVSDTGIGILQEDIPKLFRVDTYHSTAGTANETGTGLGLIICNEFIARHGGTIQVESLQGQGSTFRFQLPVHSLVDA